jgi:hypothetical protein
MKAFAATLLSISISGLLFGSTTGHSLEAEIRARTDGSQTPTIIGVTNLPDETKLLVGLRRATANYSAQANVTVRNGQFSSERFSAFGKPLPPGNYELEVSMGVAGVQSAKVQAVIGADGERLAGRLVEKTKFGTMLKSRSTINIGGNASTSADAASRKDNDLAMDKWRRENCEWINKVTKSSRSVADCIAELSKK